MSKNNMTFYSFEFEISNYSTILTIDILTRKLIHVYTYVCIPLHTYLSYRTISRLCKIV